MELPSVTSSSFFLSINTETINFDHNLKCGGWLNFEFSYVRMRTHLLGSIVQVINTLESDADYFQWKLSRNQDTVAHFVKCKFHAKTDDKVITSLPLKHKKEEEEIAICKTTSNS